MSQAASGRPTSGQAAAAAAIDFARLFKPARVALVGVSADPGKYGGRLLRYCREAGMAGKLRLVNPRYREIDGIPCHPSLADLDGPADVVIALIAPERLAEAYRQAAGTGFFISVGDLAPKASPDIARRLDDFRAAIAAGGPRIVGPQTVGVLSPSNGIALSTSSALFGGPATAGGIGVISRSGGIVASLIDRARDGGSGFSHIVSTGELFDLSICDYLEFMIGDGATKAIAINAEDLGDYSRFLALAGRARETGKPILLLKPGRSPEAAAAILSHSGRIAGRREVEEAVLDRHGVTLVEDLDDLWLAGELICRHGAKVRGGVGGVTLSGGYAGVVGDALTAAGVPVARLSDATKQRLTETILQPHPANPVDAAARPVPGQEAEDVGRTLAILEDDPAVGATLFTETLFLGVESILAPLARFVGAARKPHLTCWQAGASIAGIAADLRRAGVLVATDLAQAARALKVFYRAAARMAAALPAASVPAPAAWLSAHPGGPLDEAAARRLLTEYGVAFVAEAAAADPKSAAETAAEIGFPVVLKGDLPGCLHKTEQALVEVGLADGAAVAAAARRMAGRNPGLAGFRIQRLLSGMELIAGVASDADAGAVLLLGFGGIFAEAMERKAVEALPIDRATAERMVESLDPKGLLRGYRTGRRYDREVLLRLLVALSDLATANAGRIGEIDLNPVMVGEEIVAAVDVVISLRAAPAR
jgi:acyl-CoA synthetase (NDP forming)